MLKANVWAQGRQRQRPLEPFVMCSAALFSDFRLARFELSMLSKTRYMNGFQDLVRRTTAKAAIPSPRPVKPIRSVVVAFTLTRSTGQRRSAARTSVMAPM